MSEPGIANGIWPLLLVPIAFHAGLAADVCQSRTASLLQLDNLPKFGPCLYKYEDWSCGSSTKGLNSGTAAQLMGVAVTCPLCPSVSTTSPILYGIERSDGVGERVYQILMYLAAAATHNMSFGGFVFNDTFDGGHKMKSDAMLQSVSTYIGGNYSEMRLRVRHPHFDRCWNNALDASLPPPDAKAGQTILAFFGCTPMPQEDVFSHLSASFIQRLRHKTELLRRPVPHFSSGKLRVAVHVRRGDIMKTTTGRGVDRFIPDDFYLTFLRLLKPVVAPAEIHVFSTTEGKFAESDFHDYSELGAHVHLDGDANDDWAHMAQADVLVVAPSGFSWAAGLLNSQCVVAFASHPYAYHPNWLKVSKDFSNLGQLRACLLRLKLFES